KGCKSPLPKIPDSVASVAPAPIYDNLDRIKEVGEGILDGKVDLDRFHYILNGVYNAIHVELQKIESYLKNNRWGDIVITEDIHDDLDQPFQIAWTGMTHFLQGIDEMRLYAEDQNSQHIAVGMQQATQGNTELNEAHVI